MMFGVAPGAVTALSNTKDTRAYYTFGGDLGQMGSIELFLKRRGFNVVKTGVYPGFSEDNEEEYIRALRAIFEGQVDGWWNQDHALIKHGICTQEMFDMALHAYCDERRDRE